MLSRSTPLLTILLPLAACGEGGSATHSLQRSNVLLVLVDTLRADHLSCYGYERPTSPHVDALAREGVLFRRCLAQSTWTKPATASVHTGLYPSRHGAIDVQSVLSRTHVTLAEALAANGYATAAFGHNPHVFGDEPTGFEQGFDAFVGVAGEEYGFARAERIVDAALAWLETAPGEPFFLYLHLIDPHMPYVPPEPYASRFDRGYAGSKDGIYPTLEGSTPEDLDEDDWRHLIDLYDAEVAYVDAQIGRLLAGLEEHGALADTLVIFLSDHGEEFGDHGGWSHEPTMLEEIVHVPLICRFPGAPELSGLEVDGLALQIDVLPTLVDALGLAGTPPALEGTSLLARARGRAAPPVAGFSENSSMFVHRKAVVSGNEKLIRGWSPDPLDVLYDLAQDPGESRDVAQERPESAAALRERLEAFLRAGPGRYCLLLENLSSAGIQATGHLVPDRGRVEGGGLIDCELEADGGLHWDGPFTFVEAELDGEAILSTTFTLRTAPGDRDGVVFLPTALQRRIRVALVVDGENVDPRRIRIGAGGESPTQNPFVIDLAAADRYFAPYTPRPEAEDGEPFRILIWRETDAVAPEHELSPEAIEKLRALGYLGGR